MPEEPNADFEQPEESYVAELPQDFKVEMKQQKSARDHTGCGFENYSVSKFSGIDYGSVEFKNDQDYEDWKEYQLYLRWEMINKE